MTESVEMSSRAAFPWRTFAVLIVLALGGLLQQIVGAVMLATADELAQWPMTRIAVTVAIQAAALVFVTGAGLWLAERVGLSVPLISAWCYRRKTPDGYGRTVWISAAAGILTAASAVVLDLLLFEGRIVEKLSRVGSAWSGWALAYHAAVGEEILFRLFFMSAVAWLAQRFGADHHASMWTGLVLSTLLFGLAHLPAAWSAVTSLVLVRVLFLNGIAGIVMGWFCWRRGLESAMIVHFSADAVIYVGGPYVLL
jgi:hypothetical protein